ncbi:MAG TPA: HDIG domain-containing protein [Candidatus Limnocylindrales bacterium]|nr:HDIG domain-containing protein [Candidatus Limnocylindrales bacterium]
MKPRGTRFGPRRFAVIERLRRVRDDLFRGRRLGTIGVARRWPPYARSAAITLIIALITALVVAQNFLPNRLNLRAGDVATQDVQAPRSVKYESLTKTQEARDIAAKQVPDQFDAAITAQQRQALDALGVKVSEQRQSTSPDPDRLAKLSLLEPQLTDAQRSYLLQADDATVAAIFRDAGDLLQELMANGIKAETLRTAQATAQTRASAFRLDPTAVAIVAILVRDFLRVNFQPQETIVKRQQAQAAVPPVFVTIAQGQTIIRYGDLVSPFQVEEAQQVGLLAPRADWSRILATFILVILLFALALGYLFQFRPTIVHNPRQLLTLGALMVVLVLVAKVIVPIDPRAQYAVPMVAVPLLVAALLDTGLGIIVAFAVGLLTGIIADNLLDLTLLGFFGGAIGAVYVHRLERQGQWVPAAILVGSAQFVTVAALSLIERRQTAEEVFGIAAIALVGGLVSALIAAGAVTYLGEVMRVVTPMKLLELMTPNNPLLKRLMVTAPGTYNHSIVAANLAEAAAEAVGANAVLARVGCYFHDIGKIRRPHFFVENQAEIGNIHENLSPTTSSDILNQHVTEGVQLLEQYHFPSVIKDIVQQHQGTTVKKYFYRQALEQGLDAREDDFRYPGPRPRSREAAIVMMADTVEASTRTLKDRSSDGIRQHVHRMVQGFVRDGQLDECDLSFRDLGRIEEAFSNMVVSIYHARIEYPAAPAEGEAAGHAVDTTGGGHDGTLDSDEKTIPLAR